uniref:copper amine oxidase N-terminal domain-containing protein n=1 Tax=Alkaliphilus transvaalensis TaxID=114628 RepID=UPI00055015FA
GERITLPDAQPFVDANSRTQVPVRFVSEALGAKVDWNSSQQKVTVVLNDREIILYIGDKNYLVNGASQEMDTEALLKEGRTFVPLRFVSEALGANVRWDGAIRTVYITLDGSEVTESNTREVAGFTVPTDINLTVVPIREDLNFEARFSINFLRPDVEQQKNDMEIILSQRFSEETVKGIMDHIRPKMKETDVLEAKRFYDSKTGQYIGITRSRGEAIELWIYKPGVSPYGG